MASSRIFNQRNTSLNSPNTEFDMSTALTQEGHFRRIPTLLAQLISQGIVCQSLLGSTYLRSFNYSNLFCFHPFTIPANIKSVPDSFCFCKFWRFCNYIFIAMVLQLNTRTSIKCSINIQLLR